MYLLLERFFPLSTFDYRMFYFINLVLKVCKEHPYENGLGIVSYSTPKSLLKKIMKNGEIY